MAIVCGTDFSEWSRHAHAAAAMLAGKLGATLWLVHVLEPQVEHMGAEGQAKVSQMLSRRLEAEAQTLKALAKGAVETEVLSGTADLVLRQFAKTKQASLVVVGSAGHGSGAMVKLGGVSERLAVSNDMAVLVVRDSAPFLSLGKGAPLKVVVGVDESEASTSAVRWVEALRRLGPVDVVLGNVYYADEAHRRYGLSRGGSLTEADPTVEHLIERDLKRRFPTLEGSGELLYRARLGAGRIADHLLELAEAERCQLVVVGSHGRKGMSRMWSVSAATLHLARMSVAVVPPAASPATVFSPLPRLQRILVATDFSPLGNAAIPWAYAMADRRGEVYLAHVISPDHAPRHDSADRGGSDLEVAARLRALVPVASVERGVVTRTEVLQSAEPARALVEAVERLGIDAVAIASHGRSGLSRALLGSVAHEVLHTSRVPVFIVRPPTS